MSKPPFTHLHVHTQYSLLDGAARLKDMFDACNEMGMTHIAMSDHGNLHGAYDFFHSAQKAAASPRSSASRRTSLPSPGATSARSSGASRTRSGTTSPAPAATPTRRCGR